MKEYNQSLILSLLSFFFATLFTLSDSTFLVIMWGAVAIFYIFSFATEILLELYNEGSL